MEGSGPIPAPKADGGVLRSILMPTFTVVAAEGRATRGKRVSVHLRMEGAYLHVEYTSIEPILKAATACLVLVRIETVPGWI